MAANQALRIGPTGEQIGNCFSDAPRFTKARFSTTFTAGDHLPISAGSQALFCWFLGDLGSREHDLIKEVQPPVGEIKEGMDEMIAVWRRQVDIVMEKEWSFQ